MALSVLGLVATMGLATRSALAAVNWASSGTVVAGATSSKLVAAPAAASAAEFMDMALVPLN